MISDSRPFLDESLEKTIQNIDKLDSIRGFGKDWLIKVATAMQEGRYSDLDNLLLYASRIISRFCL